jgi:acyl-CoA synthetase (NDP forming)
VDTPRELVDLAQALLAERRPHGRRIAIIGDGGGYGAVAADLCGLHGLELPVLEPQTQEALRGVLPPTAATANPVDLAGAGEQDTFSFARSTRILLEAPEVDAVLFTAYYGGYSEQSEELRRREVEVAGLLADAVAETGRTLIVHTMYWDSPPARALRAARVPVYRAVESAVESLARLVDGAAPTAVPALPPPAAPALADAGYAAAREALAAAGISFAEARMVGVDEAAAAAESVGYPVVVKALGSLHKSDEGGVVLGLRDRRELESAVAGLVTRLGAAQLSVEHAEDVAAGFELIVGARRDARFGPIVLAGAGGIHAELLADTAVALAPVGEDEARRLLL